MGEESTNSILNPDVNHIVYYQISSGKFNFSIDVNKCRCLLRDETEGYILFHIREGVAIYIKE